MRWLDLGGPQAGAAIAGWMMFAAAALWVVVTACADTLRAPSWPYGVLAASLGGVALLASLGGGALQLRQALNTLGHGPVLPTLGGAARAPWRAWVLSLGAGALVATSFVLGAWWTMPHAFLRGTALAPFLDVASSTLLLTLAFGALQCWLPDAPPSPRAAVCAALFIALPAAFAKHLATLTWGAAFDAPLGTAVAVLATMLWIAAAAQMLLFGGALAATFDDTLRRPSRRRRSDQLPLVDQPLPRVPTATSLTAARTRHRVTPLIGRPRSSAPPPSGTAVLLHFPDIRQARRDRSL